MNVRTMKAWLRQISLVCLAVLPSFVKRPIYRVVFGYRISSRARIGIAYLDCRELVIDDHAVVSSGVVFLACGKVHLGHHAKIGKFNLFRSGQRIELGPYSWVMRLNIINAIPGHDCIGVTESGFYLGYGSVVTSEHRVDFTDRVTVGRNSILGGRNSSFWTHNRRRAATISVGDYCYLGSEIRMAPGSSIPDFCIVGMGSVVAHAISEPYSLIGGSPAKRQRTLTPADHDLLFTKTRPDLPDETVELPVAWQSEDEILEAMHDGVSVLYGSEE